MKLWFFRTFGNRPGIAPYEVGPSALRWYDDCTFPIPKSIMLLDECPAEMQHIKPGACVPVTLRAEG